MAPLLCQVLNLSLVGAKESRDVIEEEYEFLFVRIKKAETQNLKITGREVKLKSVILSAWLMVKWLAFYKGIQAR